MSADDRDVLDADEALAMLEFHSAIHKLRTLGMMITAIGGGIALGPDVVRAVGETQSLFVVLAFVVIGSVIAFGGPRVLMQVVSRGVRG